MPQRTQGNIRKPFQREKTDMTLMPAILETPLSSGLETYEQANIPDECDMEKTG